MDAADGKPERREAILGELAELGLTLARDLHGRALAADDVAQAADLALAFHRISRSVRQTLALDAKLDRERRLMAREDASDLARQTLARIQKKRSQVRRAISDDIWNEYEDEDAEVLTEALGELVMEESMEDGFLDTPIETCVARIRADLGLAAAALAEGANDADADPPPASDGEPWESSG